MSQEEFDEMFGDQGVGDLFELLFGQRSASRRGRRSAAMQGEDLNGETTLTLEEAYHGTTRLIGIDGLTIRVTIKPGIADGQVLRIAGKGGPGMGGAPNGDLYLTIRIPPHPEYRREGDDLHVDMLVDLYTVVLGGKAQVHTFKGPVKVNIPKGTQNGTVLRLRGLGMPVHGKRSEYGNLFVRVVIQVPDHLSDQELDLFKKLASLRSR